MKPTWGIVSREGARTFSPSLDTIGWFAKSASDLELLYDVFDPEPEAASVAQLEQLRLAVCRSPMWDHAEAATKTALVKAADAARCGGAELHELELPAHFEEIARIHKLIMHAEARASFLPEYRADYDLLHESFRGYVENCDKLTRQDLLLAYDLAARYRSDFDHIASQFDAVLTPSAVGEAPDGISASGSFIFNGAWTLLHGPCVNVPGLRGPSGLPVGLTITGPRFSDRRVLAVAAAVGQVLDQTSSVGPTTSV